MRWSLLLVLLVPCLAAAGTVDVAFEHPVQYHATTRYVLRTTAVIDGQTLGTSQPLSILSRAECQQRWPDGYSDETLCAAICLGIGDYDLVAYAVSARGTRTDDSNVFHLDITSTTPCVPNEPLPPPPPRPPPPPPTQPPSSPPSSNKTPPAVVAAILAGGAAAIAAFPGGSGVPNWFDMINFACVDWRITGPCFCNPFTPCLRVEYWEPDLLIETVKQPGKTLVPVLGDLVSRALTAIGLPAFGGGAFANVTGTGAPNLQFHEAHVYRFPQFFGGPCGGCAPGMHPPLLHYASEIDPAWRADVPTLSPASIPLQIGVWARLYPRAGKVFHSSEPVGSGACAVRAMDVAFNPVDATIPPVPRVVLAPTGSFNTCMQMTHPVRTPCLTAGTPPPFFESGTLSMKGEYVWLTWSRKSCCVPPNQVTCGITLPVLGQHGANGCIPIPNP